MAINLNEAIVKIRKLGDRSVRSVPMVGEKVNSGLYCIEVFEGNSWSPIIEGVTKSTADQIISQATNKTLLG